MGHIKVLLVGVCIYPVAGLPTLPICANDVQTVKNALISGLKVAENDIHICGKYGTVTQIDLLRGLTTVLATTTPDDTFIFYFSGHGGKNSFALSDGNGCKWRNLLHDFPPYTIVANFYYAAIRSGLLEKIRAALVKRVRTDSPIGTAT